MCRCVQPLHLLVRCAALCLVPVRRNKCKEERAKLQASKNARRSVDIPRQPAVSGSGLKRTGAETKMPSPLGLSSSKASVSTAAAPLTCTT
jgi:hypothetical protein